MQKSTTPPQTETRTRKPIMTTKSALRQLPAILAVFGTGLYVHSVEMVYLVDAGQEHFTLHREAIISAVGTVTIYPMKAGMNHA